MLVRAPMDPELLADFREGTQAAKTRIFLMYVLRIEAWVGNGFFLGAGRRVPGIKNEADHADAVQEIFLRAFEDKARLAYDGEQDYWHYLSTIARNVVVDYWRRRGHIYKSDPTDVLASAEAPQEPEPEHGYLEPPARAIVRQYVAALRDPMRAIHHAIYVERWFQERTANHLGISRRKLQKLLERMHREVRTLLEQAGIRDSTVAARPEDLFHG